MGGPRTPRIQRMARDVEYTREKDRESYCTGDGWTRPNGGRSKRRRRALALETMTLRFQNTHPPTPSSANPTALSPSLLSSASSGASASPVSRTECTQLQHERVPPPASPRSRPCPPWVVGAGRRPSLVVFGFLPVWTTWWSFPCLRREGVCVSVVLHRLYSPVLTSQWRGGSHSLAEAVGALVLARLYQAPAIRASSYKPRPNLCTMFLSTPNS